MNCPIETQALIRSGLINSEKDRKLLSALCICTKGRETAIENSTMTISGLSSLRYKYGGTVILIFKRGLRSPPPQTRLTLRGY